MNAYLALAYLLISLFLFFRYIRADKTIVILLFNFIFLGLTVYEIGGSIKFLLLIGGLIVLEIYIAFLKRKKDSRILKFQKGYKPIETVLHYVIFGLIVFVLFMIISFMK